MGELGRSLEKLVLLLKVKTGEDGKMFGTVTSGMITDELKHQFDISLDKKKIHIPEPIRALGDHEVEMHLHPEVKSKLKLKVESSTPLPPPEEVKPDAKAESRTDKRGRRPYGAAPHREEKPTAKTAGDRPHSKPSGERPAAKARKAE
jgi:large subunit ribosomal protein L9